HLIVCPTPIGNLEDVTLRVLSALRDADLIACEDTRRTRTLLDRYGVSSELLSYHEHNERERAAELVAQMERGQSVAVVTDAGMPGISDPGYRLVTLAVEHQITVVPIPGACAFLAALVASGLPTDSFRFNGFLPSKLGQRRTALEQIKNSQLTEIYYEAPHRIVATLQDVVEVLAANRNVVIAREVTKIHEEFLRMKAADALAELEKRGEVRGEITLLIGRPEEGEAPAIENKSVRQRVRELMQSESMDEREAMKRVAKERGVSKSEIYRELQKGK
ncbi:MAG TPA: 16S rRNA (cytidine(1402)-2'-O)-methyltransferase, partial [Terriglobales bacterium]